MTTSTAPFIDRHDATFGRNERVLFQDGHQGILFNPHRDGEEAANARSWLAHRADLLLTQAGAFYLCRFIAEEDEAECYRLFAIERVAEDQAAQ